MADRLIGRQPIRSTGGGRGIRTREGLPPTRSPGVPLRPLGQATAAQSTGAIGAGRQVGRTRQDWHAGGEEKDPKDVLATCS
jgi:hypothetical protein